ncbi:MAG: FixH family protein [Chloroflexota bacterium]
MRIALLVVVLLLAAGCRQAAPTPNASTQAAQIALTIAPDPPTVGDATLTITVMQQNQPLAGAAVAVRGDMTHAGMRPVIPDAASTDAQGKLVLPFKWSMSGDWIVSVTVTLADKTQIAQDFNVIVKP